MSLLKYLEDFLLYIYSHENIVIYGFSFAAILYILFSVYIIKKHKNKINFKLILSFFIFFFIIMSADIFSTQLLVDKYGLELEANPLARIILNNFKGYSFLISMFINSAVLFSLLLNHYYLCYYKVKSRNKLNKKLKINKIKGKRIFFWTHFIFLFMYLLIPIRNLLIYFNFI